MFPAHDSRPWGVAGLLAYLTETLAQRIGVCTVEGEIASFTRAASGHCYFSLKDADGAPALVRVALFRRAASQLRFAPQDGQRVRMTGRLALYEPRGELQFIAESLQPAGAGALYEQFLRLKAQLEGEGLFDPAAKRALPAYPQVIGVITSASGAALHDVCTTLARRSPQVRVVIYPSPVQGAEAPAALRTALATAQRRKEVDVLLLVRGGGSMEDLWAFNDPDLVRAVANCTLPLVCGVGHETDVTLCDLAADLRAPTPTAAAELAAPERDALRRELARLQQRLGSHLERRLDQHTQRLDRLALRLARPRLEAPRRRLDLAQTRLHAALQQRLMRERQGLPQRAQRLSRAFQARLQALQHRLARAQAQLEGLNPQRVLERGYAWLEDGQGRPITGVSQLRSEQPVHAVLADGEAQLRVERVTPQTPQAELGF